MWIINTSSFPLLFSTFLRFSTWQESLSFFNASSIEKLCPSPPGTINHILLCVLSALYLYHCRSIHYILLCLVVYVPLSVIHLWTSWGWAQLSCLCVDFSAHDRWQNPKWRQRSDVIKTPDSTPRIPLSTVTFHNFSKPAFSSDVEDNMTEAQCCCKDEME